MKLTTVERRSGFISEPASSEADFKELMRQLLDRFSKQERARFLGKENRATVAVFNFASLTRVPVLFGRSYSASWPLRKNERALLFRAL